ncbi:MAG: hypothetical protein RQ866_04865 [Bacteroidales bacterium]|nr:hypothetical protein [Bacteroidales bacterium]
MMKKSLMLIAVLAVSFTVFISSCNKDDDKPEEIKDTEYTEIRMNNEDGDLEEIIVTVKDYGKGTGSVTWDPTITYVLNGMVFVNDGQTLTIPAGTIIKGKSGQGENASALIVARGGKLMAEGTNAAPIIFTAEADDMHYDHSQGLIVESNNLPATARGLWGGVIVLGKSTTNNTTTDNAIEGIPTTEKRGLYGGSQDDDNSGVLKYISIRYGGTDIGEGNEINGLTLGAVGSETTVEYIEVISNKDDGIEWFGSTVNCKYLCVAFCGDDAIDYDESFRGFLQYVFAVQDPNTGDRIGEHDGGPSANEFGTPYAIPTFYNVTYIGRGAGKGKRLVTFRDNAGGIYANSIFVNQDKGIDIEYLNGSDDSYLQWQNGNLKIMNNIFFDVADGIPAGIFTVSADDPGTAAKQAWTDYFTTANNEVADPGLSYTISTSGGLNVVPSNPVNTNLAPVPAELDNVDYKGAFDPNEIPWIKGWTLLDKSGYLD